MINLLRNWTGEIEINGQHYNDISEASNFDFKTLSDSMSIKLLSKSKQSLNESNTSDNHIVANDSATEYRITVKQYMTKKATPEFDFMAQWNNNNPMPVRTMQGTIEKETRGMVYMHLHGFGKPTITCLCCGKELTNPISRHYGIGPVCLSKMGINRDIEDIEGIKEDLAKLEWTGWIIRSAITEQEEVQDEI